ncbi:alpha/beta hydrolase [Castellaniella hirudinis]|uniref:alpha/beta hydrolase n=1 Tax=Castellaniella hirudinis TaxID=1144617 RepID=UPI0039C428D4
MQFSFARHWAAACLAGVTAIACPVASAEQTATGATARHDQAEPAVTLPDSRTFTLQSAAGKTYRIFVALPPGPPPAQGYATLTVLDGNAYFASMAEAMRSLQAFPQVYSKEDKRTAYPTLVVGVAYPGDAVLDGQRRSWDFLPPSSHAEDIERLRGGQPGGADAFLDFLTGELRPALARRYPLHNTQHTLAGHSLGGYFVLHALTHRPDAFQRYAAISPPTWWDDDRILSDLAQRPLGDARILLATAQDEWPAYPDYSSAMLAQARTARDTLIQRGLDAKTLHYREVADEDHMTIPFAMAAAITRFAALP